MYENPLYFFTMGDKASLLENYVKEITIVPLPEGSLYFARQPLHYGITRLMVLMAVYCWFFDCVFHV